MRAGRLNHLVHVEHSDGTEADHWVEWMDQPPTGNGVPTGLRVESEVVLRHRNLPPIQPGSWVTEGDRLLRVNWTGPSDKVRHGFESLCSEFDGPEATYTPVAGTNIECRVFYRKDVEYIGDVGRVAEYRTLVEVLKHQLGGHQPVTGDQVSVDGETLVIEGLAPGGDDGVILQLVAT